MNVQSLNDMDDTRWFKQSVEALKNDSSLSEEDITRIISDMIADYVVGTIGILDLLEFSDTLNNCKARLTQDLKYIAIALSALHKYKHDKQYVHNILIDVLRKITKT